MGWREGTTAGVPSLWHGRSLPKYRGAVVLLPQSRSAVIMFTNSSTMFADHTREIAAGLVAQMEGRPAPEGYRPVRLTYIVIAIVSVLLVILQLRALLRARRKPKATASIIAFDLLLPIAIVVAIPRFFNISWRALLDAAPPATSRRRCLSCCRWRQESRA